MQAFAERMDANFLPLRLPPAKAGNGHMSEWKSLTISDGPSHRQRVNLPSPPIRRRIAKSSFFGMNRVAAAGSRRITPFLG